MTTTRKALVASTALALMLGAMPATAQQSSACDDLLQRLESMPQELPDGADWTIRDVEEAADSQDAERCAVILARVDETVGQQDANRDPAQDRAQDGAQDRESMTAVARERQRVTLEDEAVVEGIVRLDRQPPRVEVEEGQTEVQVTPGRPSVSVQEQAAQITVREQPARITVDVPQPTIRIEQAAPEIIITMPEPGVDVTEAEPRVEIRQAEPRVTVRQSAPTIDLQLRLSDNPEQSQGVQVEDSASGETYAMDETRDLPAEEAEVSRTRREPVIRMQRAEDGGARVDIARAEPRVTYERAEPQVEMSRSGEVNVEFADAGEPTVTIRREGADGASDDASNRQQPEQQENRQAQAGDQSGTTQENRQAQVGNQSDTTQENRQAQAGDRSGTTQDNWQAQSGTPNDLGISVDGFETVDLEGMTVEDLTGTPVFSPQDGSIGDLDAVILGDDRMAIEQFVIDVGGFLGLGVHSVALDASEIQLMQGRNGDMRVYVDMTEQELSERPRYEE